MESDIEQPLTWSNVGKAKRRTLDFNGNKHGVRIIPAPKNKRKNETYPPLQKMLKESPRGWGFRKEKIPKEKGRKIN